MILRQKKKAVRRNNRTLNPEIKYNIEAKQSFVAVKQQSATNLPFLEHIFYRPDNDESLEACMQSICHISSVLQSEAH